MKGYLKGSSMGGKALQLLARVVEVVIAHNQFGELS